MYVRTYIYMFVCVCVCVCVISFEPCVNIYVHIL